ncbi:glycosyltransferase family 4 protein [Candidatus Halobonum tyrrellensis]|uniref:Glycosyltransferase n=1 Tax=Candidatus Halobonum tyrrellensis G22 TaxID=1324957 RepID=V4H8B1_9EURY|nr:glycosyltransferase family 4 protein [Candidatus Halobonum tyrrellensis]ESP86920.1 glycosyltransferase [Candidatus Halobonum tyrrellensis G22]
MTDTPADPDHRAADRGADVLLVGPIGAATGGIARYMDEQRDWLAGDLHVRVHDTSNAAGEGAVWFIAAFLRSLLRLATFPLRRRPEAVHVHSSHDLSFLLSAAYVLYAKHVWGVPVVFHIHGSSFDEFVTDPGPVVGRLQRAVFDASDRVVVLSEYWRETLEREVPVAEGKLVVLPNAVDPREYDPRYGADPPRLVFVADHVERKGVAELAAAADALAADGVPFELAVAGTGPADHHLADAADRNEEVEYLGYVSEAEKRRLLSEASLFVMPTYAEGLPIAMLEGMAGGDAVVSTAVGSIPEVIGEANGRLVDPGDADALEAALRDLLDEPETVEAMGRENRRLAEERYDWADIARRLRDLYAELGVAAAAADAASADDPAQSGSASIGVTE